MSNLAALTNPDLELRFKTQYNKSQEVRLEAGKTLCEIWKRGVWKKAHGEFGEYVNEILGISKPTAYKLIGQVDKSVGQYDKKKPPLLPDVKIGKKCKELNTSGDSEPKTQDLPDDAEFSMDGSPDNQPEILIYNVCRPGKQDVKVNQQLEGEMAEFFLKYDNQIKEWDSIIRELNATVKAACTEDDPVWSAFDLSHFKDYVSNIKALIKFRRPWAECPVCGGDGGVKGSCTSCQDPVTKKGRGWCIHQQYRTILEDQK